MMSDYRFDEDMKLALDLLGFSREQLASACGVSPRTLARWLAGDASPRATSLSAFYDFAFARGLRLNRIKAQLYAEDCGPLGSIILFHGSKEGLRGAPSLSFGRDACDFGRGFYCGTKYEQPTMFVSTYSASSLYMFSFNAARLKCAQFSVDRDWMLAVSYFRGKLAAYQDHPLIESMRKRVAEADYIVAPIADNRMFEIIDSFAEGELSDVQCQHCLSATDLGSQYVLRSARALEQLTLLEHCYLCEREKMALLAEKEESSRIGRDKVKVARRQYRNEGLYIEELLT